MTPQAPSWEQLTTPMLNIEPIEPIAPADPSPVEALSTEASLVEVSIPRRCTAHSSRTGKQCKQRAIRGGTVCVTHGGSAPQVIAAARRRLLEGVDPAIDLLMETLERPSTSKMRIGDETVEVVNEQLLGRQLTAAKEVLDRAGLKPTEKLEITSEGDLAGALLDMTRLADWQLDLMQQLIAVATGKLSAEDVRVPLGVLPAIDITPVGSASTITDPMIGLTAGAPVDESEDESAPAPIRPRRFTIR